MEDGTSVFRPCGRKRVTYADLTLDQIRKGAAFSAVVEVIYKSDIPTQGMMILVGLRKDDGTRVGISGFPAGEELAQLAVVLKRGVTYQFPRVLEENFGHER